MNIAIVVVVVLVAFVWVLSFWTSPGADEGY